MARQFSSSKIKKVALGSFQWIECHGVIHFRYTEEPHFSTKNWLEVVFGNRRFGGAIPNEGAGPNSPGRPLPVHAGSIPGEEIRKFDLIAARLNPPRFPFLSAPLFPSGHR